MSRFLACILALGLAPACAQSNFAGGAKSSSPKKDDKDKSEKDAPDAGDGPDETEKELIEDEGEESLGQEQEEPIEETNEVCGALKPDKPEDEAATFTFTNEGEIRTFLNALGKYTRVSDNHFDAGGVQADQVSADAVCNIKGFKRAATFGTNKYHSCSDNQVYPWDPAVKNFKAMNACTNNRRIGNLVCQGKLKDVCAKDPGWVFGQPPAKDGATNP